MSYRSRIPLFVAEMDPRVREAIKLGADKVARSAQERVPVDTGKLRDAIRADDGYVIAGDTEAFYGHLVELGTTRTPPRPFLIPALEQNRAEVVALVSAALRGIV